MTLNTLDITHNAPHAGLQFPDFFSGTFHLAGMRITALHYQRLLRFARVRLAKLDTAGLGLLHQFDPETVIQLRVRRKTHRLCGISPLPSCPEGVLLNRGVHVQTLKARPLQYLRLQSRYNGRLQQLLQARALQTITPLRHQTRINRKLMTKIFFPAKILPVRVLHPSHNHFLVA